MTTETTKTEVCAACTPAEATPTAPDITAIPVQPSPVSPPATPTGAAPVCFPIASSCATLDAQGFVGTANVVSGLVNILGADGLQKALQTGDPVKPNDIVQTGKDGTVAIEFTDGSHLFLGRDSLVKIDDSVVNACDPADQSANSADAIQQAILAGADPSQLCQAPAAGGEPGVVGDETQNLVNVNRTGALGNVYSGYDTIGPSPVVQDIPEEPVFPGPEAPETPEPPPPPPCPVVYVQLVQDWWTGEGYTLCHVVRLVDADGNPFIVPAGHEVTVTLSYAGHGPNPATVDADYLPQYTVVIPAGESSAQIVIQSLPDGMFEGIEQYQITIAGVAALGDCNTVFIDQSNDTVIGTIQDPCPVVYAKLVHDDSNAEGWLICHQVQLVDADGNPFVVPEGHEVTVILNYAGHGTDPANPDDYVAPTVVTIPAGSSTANVVVQAIDDNIVEITEQYQATIVGVYGSEGCGEINIHPTEQSVIGTIYDNDCNPAISINDVTVNEDDGVAVFTLSLSSPSGQTVTVDYDTASGTATEWADFADLQGTLTFDPGVTSLTLSVPITDDFLHEVSENFFVNLSNATNATIGDPLGVGTILDENVPRAPDVFIGDDVVPEGNALVFDLSLSHPATGDIVLDLAAHSGSALAGDDFEAGGFEYSTDGGLNWTSAGGPSGTQVSIPNGSSGIQVRVETYANADTGPSVENMSLQVAAVVAGSVNDTSDTGTGVITEGYQPGDPPIVLIGDAKATEGQPLLFTLSLVDPVTGDPVQPGAEVVLDLAAATGSGPDAAAQGVDFEQVSFRYSTDGGFTWTPGGGADGDRVSIPASNSAILVEVDTHNDLLDEVTENMSLRVEAVVSGAVSDHSDMGTGLIVDNDIPGGDRVLAMVVENDAAFEGDPLTHKVILVKTDGNGDPVLDPSDPTGYATIQAQSEVRLTLNYGADADPGTDDAEAGDYSGPLTLSIPAGSSELAFNVNTTGDNVFENDEVYQVSLVDAFGGGFEDIRPYDRPATGTILDNDGPPCISINDVTVNEDDGVAVFTLTLSHPSELPVSVGYDTASGSATEGVDFTDTNGVLTFNPGETTLTLAVPVADDYLHEVSENFFVNLFNPSNATFGDNQGLGTLLDEGDPGTEDSVFVKLVHDDSNTEGWNICHQVQLVDVNGNPVTVPAGQQITVTLNYAGYGASPAESADYAALSTVVIAAGNSSAQVVVPTVDDSLFEGTEQYQASVGAILDSGAFEAILPHGTENAVIGTIWDNDDRPDAVNDTAVAVEEGHEWRPAGYQDHVTDLPAEGSRAIGNVLGNDSGSAMSVTDVGGTAVAATGETLIAGLYGSLFIQANGEFRYQVADGNATVDALNNGGALQEGFTYSMHDASGLDDSAELTINIQGTDDAPIIDAVTAYSPQIGIDSGLPSGNVLGDAMLTDGDGGITYNPDDAPGELDLNFGAGGANIGITYMGGHAGYQNIVGLYQIGPDGNPTAPQLIFADMTDAVDGNVPDQFLGVFQGLSGQVGFFLLPNANDGGVYNGITSADLSFEMGADGFPNIRIGGTCLDNVLFSHQQFNADGKEHVISGYEAQDDGSIVIGFEDINLDGDTGAGGWYGPGQSDRDYDDFVMKFDLCHTQGENGEVIKDISLSDVDDFNLERAFITLTNASTGDLLAVADAQGLAVTVDASTPGIVKITLEGPATKAVYEQAIESITLDADDADTSLRNFEVQVDDGDKLSNIIGFKVVPECHPDTAPTIAPDAAVVDEDALLGTADLDAYPTVKVTTGDLHVNFGANGPGSLVFLGSQHGLDTGLTSQGRPVVLEVVSDTLVNGLADGRVVFSATLNPDQTYRLELKDVVDHPENPDEDALASLQLYVRAQDADDDTALGVINITIADDIPEIAAPTTASVQTQTLGIATNLVIAFDISGSMSEQAGVDVDGDGDRDGNDTKLLLAQNAVKELIDSYEAMGTVNVLFVPFATDANATTSDWHDADGAKIEVDGFHAGGWTNYQDALQETMDHSNLNQPTADQNVYYFVSDGNPTKGDMDGSDGQSGLLPTWQSWAPDNFDHVFAIGIGDAVDVDGNERGSLEEIAGVGTAPHPVIEVVDLAQLADVLVGTASQTGVELTIGGDATLSHHFGADGPADGAGPRADGGALPFSWDSGHVGAFGSDTHGLSWTVSGDGLDLIGSRDGIPLIKVSLSDPQFTSGESGYSVVQFGSLEGIESLTIPYCIVDGDGDQVRSQLTLTLGQTPPPPAPMPCIENRHGISNIVLYLAAIADHDVLMKVKLEGFPDDVFSVEVKEFIDQHYPDQELVAYTVKAGDNFSGMGPGEGDLVMLDQTIDPSDLPATRAADADTYDIGSLHPIVELNPAGDADDEIILGAPAGNDLHGGGGSDLLAGGPGNDALDGQAGGDSLHGGAGDDSLVVGQGDEAQGGAGNDSFALDSDLTGLDDFIKIDGGEGQDSLDMGGFFEDTIDLTVLANRVDNIEILKLGSQDSVSLSLQDVVDMTDSNHCLFINGDTSNAVNIDKGEWTDNGTTTIDNTDYHAYSGDNGAMLYVDVSIHTVLVEDPNNNGGTP
ncbi:MAG: retention module-containing protein [Gammaproteobacteria bacterium]|nr:retention module-containing protein [Gammaproteobacteria bacterium]MBU1653728.1 retention module-containing protein [Gammaproteobacteria bacterium]MBU1960896.1 retention module-containing protein [Gammaproteobacteria bacterium]